jgi:hypothetical protein
MEIDPDDPTWTELVDAVVWESLAAESIDPLTVDPGTLAPDVAVEFAAALQRAQARLAALEARALVAAAGAYVGLTEVIVVGRESGRERDLTIADEMRDELAAALRRSSGTMHDDLVTARLLAGLLPQTAASLADGRITARHARAIVDHARRLDGYQIAVFQHPSADSDYDAILRSLFTAMCAQLEASVLPIAERTTPQRTDAAARRAVAVIDAEGAERRRQRARATIDVRITPEDDDLALLLARLPLEQAARVHAALDARARLTAADCVATLGELRAQALVDAVCGTCLPDAPAAPAGVQVEVQVVIDAAALTGLVDLPAVLASGPAAGSPMTAQAVRDLLADPDVPTSLRRLVTDPITGHLLDRGRHSYQVTDAMRAFLAVRDRSGQPAHAGAAGTVPGSVRSVRKRRAPTRPTPGTGLAVAQNNQLKTHARWEIIESRLDGSCTWRSPLGRIYVTDPPPVLPHPPPF